MSDAFQNAMRQARDQAARDKEAARSQVIKFVVVGVSIAALGTMALLLVLNAGPIISFLMYGYTEADAAEKCYNRIEYGMSPEEVHAIICEIPFDGSERAAHDDENSVLGSSDGEQNARGGKYKSLMWWAAEGGDEKMSRGFIVCRRKEHYDKQGRLNKIEADYAFRFAPDDVTTRYIKATYEGMLRPGLTASAKSGF